jgi:peroxiredoxin Q/BCP
VYSLIKCASLVYLRVFTAHLRDQFALSLHQRDWATFWAFDYSTYTLITTMVELRKRPAPPPAAPPAKKKAAPKSRAKKDEPKAEEPVAEEPAATEEPAAAEEPAKEDTAADKKAEKKSSGPPKQGDKIDLESFGGEIENNDGEKVTLASLVQSSKKGVVLFTYPKASTP